MGAELRVDAKATIGMITRQGVGKMKHVEVNDLSLQEDLKRGRFKLSKVPRTINIAELMASPSKAEDIRRNMWALGFGYPAS